MVGAAFMSIFSMGTPKGPAGMQPWSQTPKTEIQKIKVLYILGYQKFYVIFPSAKISH
jgi:hypothetical protein